MERCALTGKIASVEAISKIVSYDPCIGVFYWIESRGRVSRGKPAGTVGKDGRLYITCDGEKYSAHRLAWLITYRKWPDGVVDHIDGDPLNNRLINLRDVSKSTNQQNQLISQRGNSSELLGVSWHEPSGKWRARIFVDKKEKYLGLFLRREDAHDAYLSAKRLLHRGCTI